MVSKSTKLSWTNHLKYFQTLLYTQSHTFMQSKCNFHTIFHKIWLFNHFQHNVYQKDCTHDQNYIGDTFIHLSYIFAQLNIQFGNFSQFWYIENQKSIYSGQEFHWWYFYTLSHTLSCNQNAIIMHFITKGSKLHF